ncbi:YeaC family protein [Endozoicomonas montiporae]|uniref:DUF1315 domain-containing protein n=1 Tax=Endozoicomonas montiporae CL-33 TaxID=570277 RepID=A0A142BE84_9GAMM|nr:DUF1315 family protein [Endozoicomonas montiporae]AMO57060.1 hypothetical protein EZMO1_3025 [Endozoicomonas montiporae CL-33]
MQLTDFLEIMNPDLYQVLKQSVELGRWPDGRQMSEQEREASLQALIAWEFEHLPEDQRIGYMPVGCKSSRKPAETEEEAASILRFKDS